jgi:hypothetical protein
LKIKGKIFVRFQRKRLLRIRNANGKIIKGKRKVNEEDLSDGKENGRGNSGKINTKNFWKYNLESHLHLVRLYLHMKLGFTTYQVH